LVAYIVPQVDRTPSVSELRSCLRRKLPEYMVPNAFLMLDQFPLTPNGKIDRRALPSPTGLRPELESAYVAPQTEMEQKIAAIWQAVLQLEQIGVNDNFFDLGGHSLRLAEVHGKLRETLRRDVSMLEMFEYPTIRSLAHHLSPGKDEALFVPIFDERMKKLREGKRRVQQLFRHRR
jgi:acyl carrier protein